MKNIDLLGGTEIIGDEECWDFLRAQSVGRLAVADGPEVDIFPVNYGVDGDGIVFRTNAGRKMIWASGRPVAFEVDHIDLVSRKGWSVVVHGVAHDITRYDSPERVAAARPWTGSKDFLVRIAARTVTGRRIGV